MPTSKHPSPSPLSFRPPVADCGLDNVEAEVCEIDVVNWGRAECVSGLSPSIIRPSVGATALQIQATMHAHAAIEAMTHAHLRSVGL